MNALSDAALRVITWTSEALGVNSFTLTVALALALLGAVSGMVGCFTVLRRRALVGDALAHAALPGLCLAFLIAGERSLPVLLAGALASGVAGIAVVVALRRFTRTKEDSALGIVISVFFGAGIVLSGVIQRADVGNKAGLDSYILGKASGIHSTDVLLILGIGLVCAVLVMMAFKEFRAVAFDVEFSRAQGWPVGAIDFALLAMAAVVVVVGLPAVGVVLVAALLIIPAAAARFWTERLGKMTLLAAVFGATTGVVGTVASASFGNTAKEGSNTNTVASWVAAWFDNMPTGPIVVLSGVALFAVSALCAPRRGIVARWLAQRRFAARVAADQLLADLFDAPAAWLTAWNGRSLRLAFAAARRDGFVIGSATAPQLTGTGQAAALAAARNRRLWQVLLTEYPDLAAGVANPFDETVAAHAPPDVVASLEALLRAQGRWPEGSGA